MPRFLLGKCLCRSSFFMTKSPGAIVNVRVVAAGIACCHSPIGLEIEAETPEEIVASIVTELISCPAARRG